MPSIHIHTYIGYSFNNFFRLCFETNRPVCLCENTCSDVQTSYSFYSKIHINANVYMYMYIELCDSSIDKNSPTMVHTCHERIAIHIKAAQLFHRYIFHGSFHPQLSNHFRYYLYCVYFRKSNKTNTNIYIEPERKKHANIKREREREGESERNYFDIFV